jgi:hypothetical protein
MKARRDGKGNVELLHEGTGKWFHWIPEHEIETRRGLIRWIRLLTEKNWVTRGHIAELIDISFIVASKG